jgi:FKBP-type peptidyl-prolyl cis-trans isomerase
MKKMFIYLSAAFLLLASIGVSSAKSYTSLSSGLQYKDLRVGSGSEAKLGDTAVIHFVGWVDKNGQRGREIYNSRKEREPVSFVIGTDKVLQGWNDGVIGMQVGGTRLIRIPPELGYGAKAIEDVVPSNSYLQFIIELLELK